MSKGKQSILQKIRMALATPTPLPFPQAEGKENPVQPPAQDLVVEFAEQFSALQGKFIFCLDKTELQQGLEKLLPPAVAADTTFFCCFYCAGGVLLLPAV